MVLIAHARLKGLLFFSKLDTVVSFPQTALRVTKIIYYSILYRHAIVRGGRDRHTALTLLLLAVHEESEREGTLAQTLRLLLQLLELTLRQTTELEQQTPGRRGLATVDVAADHNREVLLLSHG